MTLTMILIGELLLTAPMAAQRPAQFRTDPAIARPLLEEQTEVVVQVEQLTNPRTGTTCTMQILRGRPLDPRAVVPVAPAEVDPGIRGRRISPCLD